jgi:hypothetical protein
MWKLFSYQCLQLGVVQAWTTPQPSADRSHPLPGTLDRTLKYHGQPNATFQKYHSTLLRLFLDTISKRLVNKRGATTLQTPGIRRDRFWLPWERIGLPSLHDNSLKVRPTCRYYRYTIIFDTHLQPQ